MSIAVAIDGPAAAGKGTIARALAAKFSFGYLDTGLLYRATGRKVLDGISPLEAAETLTEEDLTRDDLRTGAVGEAASKVAVLSDVRAALLDFQRAFARRAGGAILDGRDIGTVICPEAEVKLFVTASDEVRARRRFDELVAANEDVTFESVLEDLRVRDARDAEREDAPLRPADDAVHLDTTTMSIDAAIKAAAVIVQAAIK